MKKHQRKEFYPGRELGVFGIHHARKPISQVVSVIEGPDEDEVTLKMSYLEATRSFHYTFSIHCDFLVEMARDIDRISERTEALRVFGSGPRSELEVTAGGRKTRVLMVSDPFGEHNVILSIIDADTDALLATVSGRQLAEGFTLLELVVVVVVVAIVAAAVVSVVALEVCVPTEHSSTVTIHGSGGSIGPVSSGTGGAGGGGGGTAPVVSATYSGTTKIHKTSQAGQ